MGILLGLIAFSQLQLWNDNRVLHIWRLYQSNLVSETENAELRASNHELEMEIANMKSGFEAIEREAREELGMIRKGETFFRLINGTSRQDVSEQ